MEHKEIIAKIGIKPLVEATNVEPNIVYHWKMRGRIPAKYWSDVIRAALDGGHSITADMLMEGLNMGGKS